MKILLWVSEEMVLMWYEIKQSIVFTSLIILDSLLVTLVSYQAFGFSIPYYKSTENLFCS